LNTYDFTGTYQGGPGTLVTLNVGSQINNPKTAILKLNFNP